MKKAKAKRPFVVKRHIDPHIEQLTAGMPDVDATEIDGENFAKNRFDVSEEPIRIQAERAARDDWELAWTKARKALYSGRPEYSGDDLNDWYKILDQPIAQIISVTLFPRDHAAYLRNYFRASNAAKDAFLAQTGREICYYTYRPAVSMYKPTGKDHSIKRLVRCLCWKAEALLRRDLVLLDSLDKTTQIQSDHHASRVSFKSQDVSPPMRKRFLTFLCEKHFVLRSVAALESLMVSGRALNTLAEGLDALQKFLEQPSGKTEFADAVLQKPYNFALASQESKGEWPVLRTSLTTSEAAWPVLADKLVELLMRHDHPLFSTASRYCLATDLKRYSPGKLWTLLAEFCEVPITGKKCPQTLPVTSWRWDQFRNWYKQSQNRDSFWEYVRFKSGMYPM